MTVFSYNVLYLYLIRLKEYCNMMLLLIIWLLFIALVYIAMWVDHVYYKYNLPQVFRKLTDAFTEEV